MSSDDLKIALWHCTKNTGKIKIGRLPRLNPRRFEFALFSRRSVQFACHQRQPSLHTIIPARKNITVVSDSSAVWALGNIGPSERFRRMENACCLNRSQEWKRCRFVSIPGHRRNYWTVKILARCRDCLEDISAPRCVTIERRLKRNWIFRFSTTTSTASIVVSAALLNLAKLYGLNLSDLTVVLSGTEQPVRPSPADQNWASKPFMLTMQGVVKMQLQPVQFCRPEMLDEGIIDSFTKSATLIGDAGSRYLCRSKRGRSLTPEMVKDETANRFRFGQRIRDCRLKTPTMRTVGLCTGSDLRTKSTMFSLFRDCSKVPSLLTPPRLPTE